MQPTQQVLHSLQISRLKGFKNLDEIKFDDKPLTAILGVNGCGKSTLLHALACCYQPNSGRQGENFKFSHFFTPTTDATWAGSQFSMNHSYRVEQERHNHQITTYSKQADRWAPRYSTRPERDVIFIGIRTCVPTIETESYTSLIRYVTTTSSDVLSATILLKVGTIFNRNYTELNSHNSTGGKRYSGLAYGGIRYSSLSMGAGEQRVLLIIGLVFNAPKYSLILIDEIDLLLHTDALKRLLKILHDRAAEKSLQIVFTTHREAVLELDSTISIKHILQTPEKSYCFSDTKPDAIHRLTGQQERPIEIFVEDDMAKAIVTKELAHHSMQRFAAITPYGAAANCFALGAGLLLRGHDDFSNKLIVLDGDIYRSESDRLERIKAVLSGTESDLPQKRSNILAAIKEFNVGNPNITPEAKLHLMLRNNSIVGHEEIVQIANSIEAVNDTHSFVGEIIERLGVDRLVGLSKIVDAAYTTAEWPGYVAEIRQWLNQRRANFVEAQ
uniref:AAA family ATPase n=1 Tax=Actimicrobium sp. GrIS 1.19 TaxID=3071708 RepID=UPI002E049772|nr:ABC-type lipoprotein export system ATPase subunit [Actimicrobium sp. GrIS 1.19]